MEYELNISALLGFLWNIILWSYWWYFHKFPWKVGLELFMWYKCFAFLFSDFLFITQFGFQNFKVFVTLFILVNKDGAWETELLSGGDLVGKISTDVYWQQLEEAWKSGKKQVSKDLTVSQVPPSNGHLCCGCLEDDPWTIRIRISIRGAD